MRRLVILLIVLAACAPAGESVFSLEIGHCFDTGDEVEVGRVDIKPCSEPHEFEVMAATDLSTVAGFDDAELSRRTEAFCVEVFPDYVGIAYEESVLELTYLIPTDATWADGDREGTCIISDPLGLLTASMRGAGR